MLAMLQAERAAASMSGLKRSLDESTLFALLIEWTSVTSVELFRNAAAHGPFRGLLGRHLLQADVYRNALTQTTAPQAR